MLRATSLLFVPFLFSDVQGQDTSGFGRFKAELLAQPSSPVPPEKADLKHYHLVWRSFNEGTFEHDQAPERVEERITLQKMLIELEDHRDGKKYPIIYSFLSFHGDRYAYIHADWQTNVPRGEDLYFERAP
ncbi:MAG: hypothetical protein KDB88_08825 [Flavobacteriales bacterium]|nr:hypothetical protein [Flavobacteriales bacterium]